MTFTAKDYEYMSLALQLAEKGRYTTRPNPCVGCVIVRDQQVIAKGWHYRAGEPHAEIHALNGVTPEQARGATVYVTLEPCSHTGRTGPCAVALVRAGVDRVVYGMQDPNPQVAGNGLSIMRDGGITVDGPLMEEQARQLNPGFISRMQHGMPWVRCKLACSLDGRTAMASGESQWITGPAARQDVQKWRARSSAIITGMGSIQHDNSRLSVRKDSLMLDNADDVVKLQPLRVVLDTKLSISPNAAIFQEPGQVIIFCSHEMTAETVNQWREQLSSSQQDVVVEQVPLAKGKKPVAKDEKPLANRGLDLPQILKCLADKYQCNEVLIEAGARLSGACLEAGVVDELVLYQAPILMGSDARPLFDWPITTMAQKRELQIIDQRMLGQDQRLIARLAPA